MSNLRGRAVILRRTSVFTGILLAASIAANAGIIAFSINGGGFNPIAAGGTFNTGNDTACGVGANCNEVSAFNQNAGPVVITGGINFTTTDALAGCLGVDCTTSALENVTMTIDNTGLGVVNVAVAFVSDTFDPSLGANAGVGIFGQFLSDNNGLFAGADAQGEMDFFNGAWGGLPGPGSFSLVTPLVGSLAPPVLSGTPFWTFVNIPGPIAGINYLVGYVGVDLGPNSAVSFPLAVEDDDLGALLDDAPEPGSYLLFGAGLVGLGVLRRRKRRADQ
jgi:PEP-CTERM motif